MYLGMNLIILPLTLGSLTLLLQPVFEKENWERFICQVISAQDTLHEWCPYDQTRLRDKYKCI